MLLLLLLLSLLLLLLSQPDYYEPQVGWASCLPLRCSLGWRRCHASLCCPRVQESRAARGGDEERQEGMRKDRGRMKKTGGDEERQASNKGEAGKKEKMRGKGDEARGSQ